MVLPHNEGVTAKQAAASFVNPLTALGMVETMRMEGHTALVHTRSGFEPWPNVKQDLLGRRR